MKNRKIQNYEIIEANNKNQVVGEYVWMISNAISEFVHSTTSNRKKIKQNIWHVFMKKSKENKLMPKISCEKQKNLKLLNHLSKQ